MKLQFLAISAALVLAPTLALADQPVAAAAAADHYTTEATPIGTLLDDPAAKAVLAQDAPQVANSDQIDMARGMTLRDIQPYAQDVLTDAVLAKLDADLAKLPAKK